MPQSLSKVLVHIVYSTKERHPWLKDKRIRICQTHAENHERTMNRRNRLWICLIVVCGLIPTLFLIFCRSDEIHNTDSASESSEAQENGSDAQSIAVTSGSIDSVCQNATKITLVRHIWRSSADAEKGKKNVLRGVDLSPIQLCTFVKMLAIKEPLRAPTSIPLGPPYGCEIRIETLAKSYGLSVSYGPHSSGYITWWDNYEAPLEFAHLELKHDISPAFEFLLGGLGQPGEGAKGEVFDWYLRFWEH